MIARRSLCVLLPLVLAGCAAMPRTVVEAFPPARVATPWVLQDEVWVGSFEEAAPALGEDAGTWAKAVLQTRCRTSHANSKVH